MNGMSGSGMEFQLFWHQMEEILTGVPSSPIAFNQYVDCNHDFDAPDSASIRLDNLKTYLEASTKQASVLIVGEAAGPWGTRFSGVPFTGELQLIDPKFPITGRQSSKTNPDCKTRKVPPYISRSAVTFWEVMLPYHPHFMVWDAFPLHSHEPDQFLTVRNPTKKEVSQFAEAIRLIKDYMQPTHIVAVGKKAFRQLEALGEPSTYVRHPSRGGKSQFLKQMRVLFESPYMRKKEC